MSTTSISAADQSLIEPYRNLPAGDIPQRAGLIIAEGAENVRWLLQSQLSVHSVLAKPSMAELLAADIAACASHPVVITDHRQAIDAVVGFPFSRGIIACATRPVVPSLSDQLHAWGPGPLGLVLLDAVHDHANVGATIRNARCFGIHGVVLTDGCGDPFFRKSIRVSVGHVFHLPMAQHGYAADAVALLRQHDIAVIAAHRGPLSTPLHALKQLPQRWCLVLGNEDRGPHPDTLANCSSSTFIDMAPGVDSLNVAAAGAVCMHALRTLSQS